MENLHFESSDDIHALIGQMVSQMLNTGKPLEVENMLAFLQEQADQSADNAYRHECVMAMRAIADRVR